MAAPIHRRTLVSAHWSPLGTTTTMVFATISTMTMMPMECTMRTKSCCGQLDSVEIQPTLGIMMTSETVRGWRTHPILTPVLTWLTWMMTTIPVRMGIMTSLRKGSIQIPVTMATSQAIGTMTTIAFPMKMTNYQLALNWVHTMGKITLSPGRCIWMLSSQQFSPVLCSH